MSRIGAIARKLMTALRLPPLVLIGLVPAWLLIGAASAVLALVHFRRIAPWLGVNLGAVNHRPECTAQQAVRARHIGLMVTIAARYAPFRSNCLPQAMVAKFLCVLSRVPCAVFLGVDRDPENGAMLAHAWTSCGDVTPTGGVRSFGTYVILSCFVPAAEAEAAEARRIATTGA